MKKNNRKQKTPRIDTPSEQMRIISAAGKKIVPPDFFKLDKLEKIFFDCIIEELAKAEWTKHQIQVVSFLARTMTQMFLQQELLKKEGPVLISKKGLRSINHRQRVVDSCYDKIFQGRRSLSIHARMAPGLNKADTAKRNAIAKEIEMKVAQYDDDDDLLAKPD